MHWLTPLTLVVTILVPGIVLAVDERVLGPSGEVLIAPSAGDLDEVISPGLAPAPGQSSDEVKADCLSETNTFYGSDFLSTKRSNESSPADCCATCKLAIDCTVWNWCGNKQGCILPPNLSTASNTTLIPFQTCIWKPKPILYAGTLPVPPTSNSSAAMVGWTSGIPINGSLLPILPGYELTPGIELDYNEDVDFYCAGSSTSKPVCQLYGSAKAGALACLNNPFCRGFQLCWPFPASNSFSQRGIVRMKSGAEAPLNISGALQNPYCSVYVLHAGAASSPNDGTGGFPLRDLQNSSSVNSASLAVASSGRRLQQSGSKTAPVPVASLGSANPSPASAPAPLPGSSGQFGTNFSTPFLQQMQLQAFAQIFNYTQCYSNAPILHVSVQPGMFPAQGPKQVPTLHIWWEKDFHSSASTCCVFQDAQDLFLDLETGALAQQTPTFVATDISLTTGPNLMNYDTVPVSVISPLVYIPAGQMNSPAGQGRQFTFPRRNGTDYVSALETIYFTVAQTALGSHFCTPGYPELAATVNFLRDTLAEESDGQGESPGGIPLGLEFVPPSKKNPDGSLNSFSCLVEEGVMYEGDVLQTVANSTVEKCCESCWLYYEQESQTQCDVWVLNSAAGSCELRNATAAREFKAIPAQKSSDSQSIVSGRRTAILGTNVTNPFPEPNL